MKVLNLFYSSTGNTQKVAEKIEETFRKIGYPVETVKITGNDQDIDILDYPLIVVGSGVYGQLPGKQLMELFRTLHRKYVSIEELKPGSPRRPSANVVVYCTYGGVHTGINEAVPAVKFMGQLFDHLGYTILAEWYVVGEYKSGNIETHNTEGRLGDIRGRPDEADLRAVAEKIRGVFKTLSG